MGNIKNVVIDEINNRKKDFTVSVIVAYDEKRAIGFENKLLYHIKNDMIRFKNLTMGHTVIMGRKTFESLPNGALPGRRNIVITHNPKVSFENAETALSLEDAIDMAKSNPEETEAFIIGGASVYSETIEKGVADSIYVTRIMKEAENADSYFPVIPIEFDVVWGECYTDETQSINYCFEEWKKNPDFVEK